MASRSGKHDKSIRRLYTSGLSGYEIGQKLHIPGPQVYSRLKSMGLMRGKRKKGKKAGKKGRRGLSAEKVAKIRNMRVGGFTIKQISKKLRVSAGAINRHSKGLGKRRHKKGRKN